MFALGAVALVPDLFADSFADAEPAEAEPAEAEPTAPGGACDVVGLGCDGGWFFASGAFPSFDSP